MKSLFKLLVALIIIAAIFGAGYYTASQRTERLNRLLISAKSDMSSKVSGLEGEIRTLRFRMQLTTARDHMLTAQNQIQERNFGTAEKELESAKGELLAATKLISKDKSEPLIGLIDSIDGVIAVVRRSDARARVKLEAVEADLDRVTKQY